MKYFNLKSNNYLEEVVFEQSKMNFVFNSPFSKIMNELVFSRRWFSKLYGDKFNKPASAVLIPSFIDQYKIDMQQFETASYSTFNDFFIRKFKEHQRQFPTDPKQMGAPCEGRFLGYEKNDLKNSYPVKGHYLKTDQLLGIKDQKLINTFKDGPILIARLAPQDYHRFHFFDDGQMQDQYSLDGRLYTVNPIGRKNFSFVYQENHRTVNIMNTQNFGKVAYIEVGAFCVGKIVHTHLQSNHKRGQEKGYFLFGGSSLIILGQPHSWKPVKTILEQTSLGYETLIELGSEVGEKNE